MRNKAWCFECKEPFVLHESHKKDFDASSLCPKCFKEAMEQGTKTEDYEKKVIGQLDQIINEIQEINKALKSVIDNAQNLKKEN